MLRFTYDRGMAAPRYSTCGSDLLFEVVEKRSLPCQPGRCPRVLSGTEGQEDAIQAPCSCIQCSHISGMAFPSAAGMPSSAASVTGLVAKGCAIGRYTAAMAKTVQAPGAGKRSQWQFRAAYAHRWRSAQVMVQAAGRAGWSCATARRIG